jgi:tetratricopeptide (TPR) repeat protein
LLRRLRSIFGSGTQEGPTAGVSSLSDEELEKIGTTEDPLHDYEAALERNFAAMEAERRGDTERAIALYESSVAGEFVKSHPYERLASLYEQRGGYPDALRVLEAYVRLAESGKMPRGAQRSADRKLPDVEARVERYRRRLDPH